ncbi:hypothetical protein COU58_04570 [Candidatus Pacearchaeota archaeon CG10_big_fil_rev_8_21_14_0_10_32_42]|nr:MAG: hypothetical protein COU58_04570 [Candidatus Pacearchaeota archaeon CG10_big_fil_rev_8_21_14_0_10_32_42]
MKTETKNNKLIFWIVILCLILLIFFFWSYFKKAPQEDISKAGLDEIIAKELTKPVSSPPALIKKCTYNGETVYYYLAGCCDQFNDLYNEQGEKICSPNGGISGKGDGKCQDFQMINCELVWEDTRT